MTLRHFLSVITLLATFAVNAAIQLPSVIGDNMVLQQQTDARLWGTASPGRTVSVTPSWDGKTYTAKASSDGRWSISIPTPTASRNEYAISISDDYTTRLLTGILVGEVWYCSGQSNMEIPLRGYNHQPIDGALDIILGARHDKPLWIFTVEKAVSSPPKSDCGGHWARHTPGEVAQCSATAYFFADEISRALGNIPVGLIISAWGGTNVQPWISRAYADSCGLDTSRLDKPVDRTVPDVLTLPATLFNAMAAPVLPFTLRGMLWYQGENNCYDPAEYERLMPVFVDCMRAGFGRGEDMPFYYVQVAPFGGYGNVEHNAGKLRVAQSHLMNQRSNCGMAVTLDIGDRDCIHPSNKRDVGKRLAYWALAKDYGKNDFAWSGPIFDHMQWDGKRALLYFKNTGGGVSPLEVELDGFEAAGEDGIYHPARAIVECETGTLGIYCDEAGEIKKVRYGHSPWFKASLFDNFGLPASPFVTSGELE